MNKKTEMNFNINNFLLATTNILDMKDSEISGVSESHSLRVAYVSLKIGEILKLEPKMMFDLCAYSLFHNYINEERLNILGLDDSSKVLSSIAGFVHEIDTKNDFSNPEIKNRILIIESLETINVKTEYIDAFREISSTTDFWMDCQTPNMILQYIYSTLYDFTEVLTFEKILEKTKMMGGIFEEVNCLLDKCNKMAEFYSFEEKDKWTFLIAGSMVNFGKLTVLDNLLHKTEKLTHEEYELLKSNIYHNKNALRSIYGFDDISKWATRHQEQLDGNGYPSKIKANELSLKDRLMAALNIYNSLLSNKPYRKNFTHNEAIEIMKLKAKNYHLDDAIVQDIDNNFG